MTKSYYFTSRQEAQEKINREHEKQCKRKEFVNITFTTTRTGKYKIVIG